MAASGRKPLDAARARELRRSGLTWREVGIQLAVEIGRQTPFDRKSVEFACSERGKRDD